MNSKNTEEFLNYKTLLNDMAEKWKNKENIDSLTSNYNDYLNNNKTGKASFDSFLELLLENKKELEVEYSKANKLQDKKANSFLEKHLNISYSTFVDKSKPETFHNHSYALINRGGIKRSLFDARAKLYLSTLNDFEKSGGDLNKVLGEIREEEVPFIKKAKEREPTFEAIYESFKKYKM